MRHKRHLFPTQQLTREAEQYGWQSVAHYLITTALVTGKDAPPMLDLPAAYVKRRQPKGTMNNGKFGSSGKIVRTAASERAVKNKEEMEREREAAALRREIEMKVGMAFGAVDGEEEDEEDGDMLNSVGDGDGGARRKAQHKRTITKRTSNIANTTTSAVNGEDDDDVHEKM